MVENNLHYMEAIYFNPKLIDCSACIERRRFYEQFTSYELNRQRAAEIKLGVIPVLDDAVTRSNFRGQVHRKIE